MPDKYYEDEIRKLELQRKNLKDQYNTLDENQDLEIQSHIFLLLRSHTLQSKMKLLNLTIPN